MIEFTKAAVSSAKRISARRFFYAVFSYADCSRVLGVKLGCVLQGQDGGKIVCTAHWVPCLTSCLAGC